MKSLKNYIQQSVLLFFILFALNCNTDQYRLAEPLEVFEVDLQNSKQISFNQLLDASEIINLELTEESGIDFIHKVVLTKDKIILFNEIDASDQKSLMIFTTDGQFIQKIDGQFDGPGNFPFISDFTVKDNGAIEILDRLQKRIITYDQTGNFVTEKQINSECFKFISIDNTNICYRGNAYDYAEEKTIYNLTYYDHSWRPLKKEFAQFSPILKDQYFGVSEYFFPSSRSDQYYYTDILNDTVFLCTAGKTMPVYDVNFPNKIDKRKTIDFLLTLPIKSPPFEDAFFEFINNPEYVTKIELVTDYNDGILIAFKHNKRRYFFTHEKSGSKGIYLNYISQLYPIDNDRFFMIIWDPTFIKNNYNHFFQNNNYKITFDQYDETSNPVLLLVKTKTLFSHSN